MGILAEDWDDSDYIFRNSMTFHALPKNQLGLMAKLQFPFEDYKANLRLACHVYEKMWNACLNQYGLYDAWLNIPCKESKVFFDGCVSNHQTIAMTKKYWPEKFAASHLSTSAPTMDEVLD